MNCDIQLFINLWCANALIVRTSKAGHWNFGTKIVFGDPAAKQVPYASPYAAKHQNDGTKYHSCNDSYQNDAIKYNSDIEMCNVHPCTTSIPVADLKTNCFQVKGASKTDD